MWVVWWTNNEKNIILPSCFKLNQTDGHIGVGFVIVFYLDIIWIYFGGSSIWQKEKEQTVFLIKKEEHMFTHIWLLSAQSVSKHFLTSKQRTSTSSSRYVRANDRGIFNKTVNNSNTKHPNNNTKHQQHNTLYDGVGEQYGVVVVWC
jgi:hypothetical protein